MVPAETAPGGADLSPGGAVAHERRHFEGQVRIESVLPVQAIGRRDRSVVPGFLIHGVHAHHLQFAAIDLGSQRADHTSILVLEEAAARSREDDDGKTGVAIRQQLHIPAKRRTVPLDVIATHNALGARKGSSYRTLNDWPRARKTTVVSVCTPASLPATFPPRGTSRPPREKLVSATPKSAVEKAGAWKPAKTKSRFPPASTLPWKSRKRRGIPTFPPRRLRLLF